MLRACCSTHVSSLPRFSAATAVEDHPEPDDQALEIQEVWEGCVGRPEGHLMGDNAAALLRDGVPVVDVVDLALRLVPVLFRQKLSCLRSYCFQRASVCLSKPHKLLGTQVQRYMGHR